MNKLSNWKLRFVLKQARIYIKWIIISEKLDEGLFQGIICVDFPILTQTTSTTLFTVLEAN